MNIKFTQMLVDYNKIVGTEGYLDPAIFVGKNKIKIEDINNSRALIYKFDEIIYVEFSDIPKGSEIIEIENKYGPFLYKITSRKSYNMNSLDEIIDDAIQLRASDIHFEPKENGMRLRFRIDGSLVPIYFFEGHFEKISNIIKVRSGMDSINKEIQDGSMEYKNVNIRVSSVPTTFGEKFVLRLLNTNQVELDLLKLGMPKEIFDIYIKKIYKEGINLVVGPTGSGKNTTLHATLKLLPQDEKNIISIEDPIEYRSDSITQLEVDNSRGRTFNKLLRASLRQDPDIIYIGEIRDEETAQVAIRSAITGHIVFSTLHTKNDKNTYERLLDLNVDKSILKNALSSVLSQRLVKTLCDDCKVKVDDHYIANGCDKCINGYKGRTAIFEFSVPIDNNEFEKFISFKESLKRLYDEGRIDLKTLEDNDDL